MRVWHPIPVTELDNKRLLGEHVEIHAIASIITDKTKGYQNHPEVNRWRGYEIMLYLRHSQIVIEMTKRGMKHKSPLVKLKNIKSKKYWPRTWEPVDVMKQKLKEKQK